MIDAAKTIEEQQQRVRQIVAQRADLAQYKM